MTNCTNDKDLYDLVTDIQLLDWPGIIYLLDLVMQDMPENSDTAHSVKVQDGLWLLIKCIKDQAKEQKELLEKLYHKLPRYRKS